MPSVLWFRRDLRLLDNPALLAAAAADNRVVPVFIVDPALWENVTDEGKAKLAAAANPNLSPEWPVSVSIEGWTTYTMDQIIACKGPGE